MKQKKNLLFLVGILSVLLVFGFVLVGCGGDDSTPTSADPAPSSVADVDLYTFAGETFTPYTGTGSTQTVTGFIGDASNSIGPIGSISAAGKLTLTLPATVENSKLDDYADMGITGLRGGGLTTTPELRLMKSSTDTLKYGYYNQSGSADGDSFAKGWNYKGHEGITSSAAGYNWVITP